MADDINDNDESNKATDDAPVADLHLSQVIAALHQNAIDKCKDQLGDKFRLVNSAIDDSGDKAALTSSGEHIVSVVLTEKAAKDKEEFSVESAVSILKTYVQWFVGPDLANKVNASDVQPLMEKNQASNDEKTENGADKSKNSSNDKDELSESTKPFMKFSQFLREAESGDSSPDFGGDDDKDASTDDASPDFDGDSKKEKSGESSDMQFDDETEKKKSKSYASDDSAKSGDEAKDDEEVESNKEPPQMGYYISYDLKVEGMKKKSKIKDSKKSIITTVRSVWRNLFGNLFDDVTFKAWGIFGSGDSFKVKDVKDAMRKAFGPIDPDELVRNVQERIEKKFKGSSPHAEVEIKNKKTLIIDLGSYVDGQQKKQIEKADYSLWIKLNNDDPKKQVFGPGSIADIVQSSITGLYKKFRYHISKDDVIYIPNYKDIHANTERIRALYNIVPSPNRIQAIIQKARDVNDAVAQIKKAFQKVLNNKDKEDCDRADKCSRAWNKFYDERKLGEKYKDLIKITNGSKQYNEFFTDFMKNYSKTFKKTEDKSLNESASSICFTLTNEQLSHMILESMFGDRASLVDEDEKKQNDEKSSFNTKQAISLANHYLSQKYGNDNKDRSWFTVECGPKDAIKKKLLFFDVSELSSSEYKNAIAIIPAKKVHKDLNESDISNDIFSILFEDDAKTSSNSILEIKDDDIKNILERSLTEAGAKTIGSFMTLPIKAINETEIVYEEKEKRSRNTKKSKTNNSSQSKSAAPQPSQIAQDDVKPKLNKAYVMMFGDEEVIPVDSGSEGSETSDNIDSNDEIERNDLYIIPIKGLKYEDPQFANKNLL